MAVLTDIDRRLLYREFMSDLSSRHESSGNLTKGELRATVDAIDSWINSNSTAFNSSIPEPARTQLSAKQKVEILMKVIKKRWEVS